MLFEQYSGEGEEGWARLGGLQCSGGSAHSGPSITTVAVSIGKNSKKGKKSQDGEAWACYQLAQGRGEVVFPLRTVLGFFFFAEKKRQISALRVLRED